MYDLESHPIRPIALGRPAHPRSSHRRRLGFQAGSWCSPISRSSADPRNTQGGLHDPSVSNQPRSRPINVYEMCYGMRGAHQEAADTLSTCGMTRQGAARQKPDRVIGRHFCDWAVCCKCVQAKSAASQDSRTLCSLEDWSRCVDKQATQELGLCCKAER